MAYDRTLIQIRERTFLDILDLSLVVIRRWPARLGLAAACGVLPFAIVDAWLFYGNPDLPTAWWGPLLILESPWATAPLTLVLGGLLFGERPRPGKIARRFTAALPTMFLTQFLVRGVLVSTVFLTLLIPSKFAFLNEVILLERAGGFRPLRRSANLCGNLEGNLLGRSLAFLVFAIAFSCCFTLGIGSISSTLITNDESWYEDGSSVLLEFAAQFSIWLSVTFAGIVRFLTYVDQRIRLEGWAVELALRDAGLALEKSLP